MADVYTFNYTGAVQTFTVPAGCTEVELDLQGGAGGIGGTGNGNALGGLGGRLTGRIGVTPGEVLRIYVGGGGADTVPNQRTTLGGYNGGGFSEVVNSSSTEYPGGGGGGGTDIRRGGTALANRIAVAGGGGGGGWQNDNGGAGGGLVGGDGVGQDNGISGRGGTQSAVGGGQAVVTGGSGDRRYNGGGGGGGYYGGGAGSLNQFGDGGLGQGSSTAAGSWESTNIGGGGGGSSFADPAMTSVLHTQGYRAGDGTASVTVLNNPPTVPTIVQPDTATRDLTAGSLTFDVTFNDPDAGDTPSAIGLSRQVAGSGQTTYWNGSAWVASPAFAAWDGSPIVTTGWTNEQAGWSVSARTKDAVGAESPWTALRTFPTNASPDQPTIVSPAGSATLDLSGGNLTIEVDFNDPDSWDSPSEIGLHRIDSGNSSYWNGSSWVASPVWIAWAGEALPTTGWYNASGGWQLRARAKDQAGIASAYSGYRTIPTGTTPVVTIANVSGDVADTSRPTVEWTVTDPDPGDDQTRYRVRWFTQAQYQAVGFDPATSAALEGSGWVTNSQTRARTVGQDLTNGQTYRAYVQVEDPTGLQSGWAAWEFTLNLSVPEVPILTLLDEPAAGRVALVVTATHDPIQYPDTWASVQFSDDSETWTDVRGATRADWQTSGPLQVEVFDYESPSATRFYRAFTMAEV